VNKSDISLKKDRETISNMFDGIAKNYDLLNRLLSFGIDVLWRKKLVRHIKKSGSGNILDLACGTGDLTRALYKKGFVVTGLDISGNMLEVAKKKLSRVGEKAGVKIPEFILGSAEEIPFGEESFDAVTISFGIRNFDNRDKCLDDIFRVTRKGGALYILEFAMPKNRIWRAFYLFYFKNILPLIGRIVSKDNIAYSYLPDSVICFPQYEKFCGEMKSAGFSNVKYLKCTGGIALLYIAEKF